MLDSTSGVHSSTGDEQERQAVVAQHQVVETAGVPDVGQGGDRSRSDVGGAVTGQPDRVVQRSREVFRGVGVLHVHPRRPGNRSDEEAAHAPAERERQEREDQRRVRDDASGVDLVRHDAEADEGSQHDEHDDAAGHGEDPPGGTHDSG